MTTDATIALGVGMAFGVAAASAVVLIAHFERARREAKRKPRHRAATSVRVICDDEIWIAAPSDGIAADLLIIESGGCVPVEDE